MDLILPFKIPKPKFNFGYKDKIMVLGSCFAEEIGSLLADHKFNTLINPHGIIYNSRSLQNAIRDYIDKKNYRLDDLIFDKELWHSLNHHGNFSDPDPRHCLGKINHAINRGYEFLKNADYLSITIGSSWAYNYIELDQIVSNCHRIPTEKFCKIFLKAEDQINSFKVIIEKLKKINPGLQIIFTVSPVKYIRDGLIENNISKAHLLTTVHSLCESYDHCHYFPAYELITDVLRDYRFYKEDLVHPNKQAVKFVWEEFLNTYLSENDRNLFGEVEAWLKLKNHRPKEPRSGSFFQEKSETMESMINEKIQKLIQP
jgi:hypothetical protein